MSSVQVAIAILTVVGVLVGIVGAIYGAIAFVDSRIEKKIQEESFLRKIAASLRPTVIFDESGSILLDQGGMDVLERIEVSHSDIDHMPEQVVIHPKRHLTHAPILQTLEDEIVEIDISRGQGYQWQYRLKYKFYEQPFPGKEKRRFRLEVVG
jgi:hypothetical protein